MGDPELLKTITLNNITNDLFMYFYYAVDISTTVFSYSRAVQYVIVIARVLGIYGSKPTRVRGRSPRTRAVYVAINP